MDFYKADGPVEGVVPLLARRVLGEGARLLVVAADPELREAVAQALWAANGAFLANGFAGGAHDARQPILIADDVVTTNGARMVVFADGQWREATAGFERAFLIFDDRNIAAARDQWRGLAAGGGMELNFWERRDGRWTRVR